MCCLPLTLFQKICDILEWRVGGPKYQEAKATLDIVWEGLLKYADTNKVIFNYKDNSADLCGIFTSPLDQLH